MDTVLANPLSNSEGTLAQHFFRSNSLSLQTGSGPYLPEIFVMIHRYYLSSDAHKNSFQWVGRADCNHLKGVRIAQRHPAYKQLIQSFSGLSSSPHLIFRTFFVIQCCLSCTKINIIQICSHTHTGGLLLNSEKLLFGGILVLKEEEPMMPVFSALEPVCRRAYRGAGAR